MDINYSTSKILAQFSYKQLISNNVHIGGRRKNSIWFEENYFFVSGFLKENFILNLGVSIMSLRSSLFYLDRVGSFRLKFLIAGQHPLISVRVQSECEALISCGLYYSHKRWLGGTISSFKHLALWVYPFLFKRPFTTYSFYNSAKFKRRWIRLKEHFFGLRNAMILPSFTFGSSLRFNPWLVRESIAVNIPHASLINSDSKFTSLVTYPISSNDSSINCLLLFTIIYKNGFVCGLLKRRRLFINLLNTIINILRGLDVDVELSSVRFFYLYLRFLSNLLFSIK